MAAAKAAKAEHSFEDTPVPDDLSEVSGLAADLKAAARVHGFSINSWGFKEDRNGQTVTFACSREPWVQPEIPFAKEGDFEGSGPEGAPEA